MSAPYSKNDDPHGCPDTVMGPCELVCARCGREGNGISLPALLAIVQGEPWDGVAYDHGVPFETVRETALILARRADEFT